MKTSARPQERRAQPEDAANQPQVEALKKLRVIIRAAQRHSTWVEKQCGVSGAQLWVMQELFETPGLRVGEIAQRLSIHQTTASNLLDALCKRGLVNKQRDQTDQRIVTLVLTKDGAAVMKKAPAPARGFLAEALQRMDEKGLAQLNKGLQALISAVECGDEASALQLLPFML